MLSGTKRDLGPCRRFGRDSFVTRSERKERLGLLCHCDTETERDEEKCERFSARIPLCFIWNRSRFMIFDFNQKSS
jgi:hypothetical protein